MTKKESTWMLKTIRLPREIIAKINFYVSEHQKRTGFELSQSAVIRTFLEEGLKNRGITGNVFNSKLDHPSESSE